MRIKHPEWRASHEPTKFPFSDDATLQNSLGDVILEGTFLDAALYPPGGQENMYLSKVVIDQDSVTIYIGDELDNERASTVFNPATAPDSLRLVDAYDRPSGILVSEAVRLSAFLSWSEGAHEFLPHETPFIATVCIPTPSAGLQGVQLPNGDIVQGDIWLVGDDGIVLSCSTDTLPEDCTDSDKTESVIRVDVIGDPLFRRRLCAEPGEFATPRFLESLTFCVPPTEGTEGTDGTTKVASADILILSDTTGSMYPFLTVFKHVFSPLAQAVTAAFPDVSFKWAVMDYRDLGIPPYNYPDGWNIGQTFTPHHSLAQVAISGWIANGGNSNWPEAQMNAFVNIGNNWETALAGRPLTEASRILMWAGDHPGHQSSTDTAYQDMSEAIYSLTTAGIKVIALNAKAAGAGIDFKQPNITTELNQASTIVTLTGGVIRHEIQLDDVDAVRQMMIDALSQVIIDGTGGIPGSPVACYTCGPGTFGDVKITVGSSLASDTVLRIRSVPEGMIIEASGETLEGIDRRG